MQELLLNFVRYIKFCKQGGYKQIFLSQISYPLLLKEKRALITGGSDGIGLAIAKKFIAAGATVVITGRSLDKLEKAANEIDSDRLYIIQWDVCEIRKISENLQKVKELLGGLDILINNAAFLTHYVGGEDFYNKTMNTNVRAVYFMCDAVGTFFQKENGVQGGKIINISSVNSYQASTHPYYISKRAVNAITEGFAKKYAPYNIIVNGIAPGYCNSSINKQDVSKNAYWPNTANNRITLPSDIAELAMFLCSGAANHIVGQTICCDGGALL